MRKSLLIILGLLLFSQQIVAADEFALTNMVLSTNRDNLLLYLKATGTLSEKMRAVILSGVPTSFTFNIHLNRNRTYWLNKRIVDLKVRHTIKYDNIKKEFHVYRSWDSGGSVITGSFEKAQELMTKIDSLKIASLQELNKGQFYQVRAKAILRENTLAFRLPRFLFFLFIRDVETDWYTIDFAL